MDEEQPRFLYGEDVVEFTGKTHLEVAQALVDWLAENENRQVWMARFVLSHEDDDVSLHAVVVRGPFE